MTTPLEQINERLEKMKKKSSCGCPPFRSLHDGPCWTEEFGGESKAYNRALKDVQSLLPQIITGVIEEIEKFVQSHAEKIKEFEVAEKEGVNDPNHWVHLAIKPLALDVTVLAELWNMKSSLKEVVKE